MRQFFSLPLMLVALAAAANQRAAQAQEPESQDIEGGGGSRAITRQVVVEHSGGLNESVIRLVSEAVSTRLREEQGQAAARPRFVKTGLGMSLFNNQSLSPQEILEGLEVWPLYVVYEPGEQPDAPELWEKARGEIEQSLRIVQKRTYEARIQKYNQANQRAQTLSEEAQRRLAEGTARLAQNYSGVDDDVDFLRQELRTLSSQVRELDLKQIGAQARREAIEKRIDELRHAAEESRESDPIIAELRKAVETREAIAKNQRTLHEAAAASTLEKDEAEFALTEARVQLLRAEREAARQESGPVLQQLNNELSTLFVEVAELTETRKAVDSEIGSLVVMSNPQNVAEVEMLKTRLALAQEQLALAERRRLEVDGERPPELEQITIREIDEAMFGDAGEAAQGAPTLEHPTQESEAE